MTKHLRIRTFFVVLILILRNKCDEYVSLYSNNSTVVGIKLKTMFDVLDYVAFWKIPYAEPPIGNLRFKAPKPTTWLEDNKSYDYSHSYNITCAHGIFEDCLYLSVFAPLSKTSVIKSYSVLVWLHEDFNMHLPDFFIDEGIIVVMVSYRTSIFGFLNTEDYFAPGNMGAKDVLLALKWIKDNIALFDGNADKITVMGGGISSNLVASLLPSKAEKDLYSKVIILSGSALSPTDYTSYNFKVVNKLHAKFYGPIEEFNRLKLYTSLSNASTEELLNVSEYIFDSSEVRDRQRLINSFGLSVEKTNNSFLNRHPIEVYDSKLNNNNVDVMIGFTTLPSLNKLKGIANNRKLLTYLNYNFQYLLPFEGRVDEFKSTLFQRIRQRIMGFYFPNGTIGERSLRRYARYVSDQLIYPLIRQARMHAESSCKNVYLYRFSYKGLFNYGWMSSVQNLNWSEATSGDEICYLFRCKSVGNIYNNVEASSEKHFVKKIARLLANFIKLGDPTPSPGDVLLGDLKWDPLDFQKHIRGLDFGKNLKMMNFPEEKRIEFWDNLRNEFFAEKRSYLKEEL